MNLFDTPPESNPLYPPPLSEGPFPARLIPRRPPSSFPFPFQAYPGNPDPGTVIPGFGPKSRRASFDSFLHPTSASSSHAPPPQQYGVASPSPFIPVMNNPVYLGRRSLDGVSWDMREFERPPVAPFMMSGSGRVGSGLMSEPRSSTVSFRAPFLSPASRPSSTIWSPPTHAYAYPSRTATSAPGSSLHLPLPKPKPPLPSTLLEEKLREDDKPWLTQKDGRGRASWWITFLMLVVGVGASAALCWQGYVDAGNQMIPDSKLCMVMEDDFGSLDGGTWTRDVELGGFGNGEFQMTTASDTNLFTRGGQLYILPTLTSDEIGYDKVLDGDTYTLSGCTSTNASACSASSSASGDRVIPPVQSARISTKDSYSIQYGKVEVSAKLPRGDWLWPAIWMLPVKNVYGAWPVSGEIDIMEARGNAPSYPAQGTNYVRSGLAWGPLASLVARAYGWQSQKRSSYDRGFHTYALEWTDAFVKAYVDSRLQATLDLRVQGSGGKSFWDRGKFPQTAANGTAEVVVQNPYGEGGAAAPFDQNFYLILDLAAGGTSGWFPDQVGGKMWYDGSATAMVDFAKAQSTWYATWPQSDDDRAFRIDYVKMWSLC